MAKSVQVSKASQPVKAGETPAHVAPHITFQDAMNAATMKIDALLRGGVDCVTYIASALLVGYLADTAAKKVKLSVMRDEFALALGKKGLGGTQTKKYLDMGQKISAAMFKECSYGMEMAALLSAETADKAHNAVTGWLARHTKGKKTEHGYKLDDAGSKLNVLAIYLGMELDPNKPETLEKSEAEKTAKRRETAAKAIEKDTGILSKVPAEKLLSTVAQVISFDVLVSKHVETMTVVSAIEKELAAIEKSYRARIKTLKANLGKRATATVSNEAAAA